MHGTTVVETLATGSTGHPGRRTPFTTKTLKVVMEELLTTSSVQLGSPIPGRGDPELPQVNDMFNPPVPYHLLWLNPTIPQSHMFACEMNPKCSSQVWVQNNIVFCYMFSGLKPPGHSLSNMGRKRV